MLTAVLLLPFGLHLPYFPVYLSARGLTESEIAAVIATPMALRVVVTPLVAAIADKRGIAATLAAVAAVVFAGYCGLAFAQSFAAIFAGGILVSTAIGIMPSLADALTLTEIRRAAARGLRPIAYSLIRVWTPIGVLAIMLLSGPIAVACPGDRIIVALAALGAVPALAALLAALRTEAAPRTHGLESSLVADPAHRRLAFAVIGAAALVQASHAQIYSFATLQWKAAGYSAGFIGMLWAIGVAAETLLFLVTARLPGTERYAAGFLVAGGLGAVLRWVAMSTGPEPAALVFLQAMHGLSFAATYFGSVLLLGSLAGPRHRARMQGFLAAASALSLALATFTAGRLTGLLGVQTYLVMAALASAGLALAVLAGLIDGRAPVFALHSAAERSSES